MEYFQRRLRRRDALGSVRQLVDAGGEVTLAQSYTPYGEALAAEGEATTSYAFTGEALDAYTGLVYLRARWYSGDQGRFLTQDPLRGFIARPQSLHRFTYTENNPVNFRDPSGYLKDTEETDADNLREELKNKYGVWISKDYGWGPDNSKGYGLCGNRWYEGAWKTLDELKWTKQAVIDAATAMGGSKKFKTAMQGRQVVFVRLGIPPTDFPVFGPIRPFAPPGKVGGDAIFPDYTFTNGEGYAKYSIVHELGHVWDRRASLKLSKELMTYIGTLVCDGMGGCYFDIKAGREAPPGKMNLDVVYAGVSPMEDWAEAFASTIYRTYWGTGYRQLGPLREQYVRNQIAALP